MVTKTPDAGQRAPSAGAMARSPLMRAVMMSAAFCAVFGSLSARAEYANPYGVAVFIGNKSYENERVPEVSYAHRDADSFRRFVLDVLGFNPDNLIDLHDAHRNGSQGRGIGVRSE